MSAHEPRGICGVYPNGQSTATHWTFGRDISFPGGRKPAPRVIKDQFMSAPAAVSLKRDLGLWSAVAIVVGTVIGSGIFIVPNVMIRNVGSPGMVFVVWSAGVLISLS